MKERNEKMKSRFDTNKIEYDGEKECKKCGRSLPNSYRYFPVDKTTISGLRNICRECDNKYRNFLPEDYKANKKWTKEEDEIMMRHYKDFTGEELHNIFLPNRTIRAIECRASTLGIQGKGYDEIQRVNAIKSKKIKAVLTGRKCTEEQKKLMSESKKEYYKSHVSFWLGKKRSEEQRKQMSERRKGEWVGDKNPRHINPLDGELNGRWKGGVNQTYVELRTETKEWQNKSMEFCNYHCVISGGEFDNIHHAFAFRDIVDEVFLNTNIEIREKVMDYTKEEFDILRNETRKLHEIYGFGACINKDIHKLFHDNYGYINFTPYNFLDFIYRIDCGEFDDWFIKNDLLININYGYVDYLEDILYERKSA